MRRREKDRRGAFDLGQMGGSRAKSRGLALQKRFDERDAFGKVFGLRLRQSDILRAAVAGADAEHSATVCDAIERSNRRGADCWMAESTDW